MSLGLLVRTQFGSVSVGRAPPGVCGWLRVVRNTEWRDDDDRRPDVCCVLVDRSYHRGGFGEIVGLGCTAAATAAATVRLERVRSCACECWFGADRGQTLSGEQTLAHTVSQTDNHSRPRRKARRASAANAELSECLRFTLSCGCSRAPAAHFRLRSGQTDWPTNWPTFGPHAAVDAWQMAALGRDGNQKANEFLLYRFGFFIQIQLSRCVWYVCVCV